MADPCSPLTRRPLLPRSLQEAGGRCSWPSTPAAPGASETSLHLSLPVRVFCGELDAGSGALRELGFVSSAAGALAADEAAEYVALFARWLAALAATGALRGVETFVLDKSDAVVPRGGSADSARFVAALRALRAARVPYFAFAAARPLYDQALLVGYPDPKFLRSNGYADGIAMARTAPRASVAKAFWRGAPSRLFGVGAEDPRLYAHQRVRACMASLQAPEVLDAKLVLPYTFANQQALARLAREGLASDAAGVSGAEMLRYAVQVDIDGFGVSGRATQVKLAHAGSVMLRVTSEHDLVEWWHGQLRAWRDFVPVAADGGDLLDRIRWALDAANADEVARIAAAGAAAVANVTMEASVVHAAGALRAWEKAAGRRYCTEDDFVCDAPGIDEALRQSRFGDALDCDARAAAAAEPAVNAAFRSWRAQVARTDGSGARIEELHDVAERCLATCNCSEVQYRADGDYFRGPGALPMMTRQSKHCGANLNCGALACAYGTHVAQGVVPPPAEPAKPHLLLLGDSITMARQEGDCTVGRDVSFWPDVLGGGISAVNYGAATENSTQLLSRLWMVRAQRGVTHVSLLIGINDAMLWAADARHRPLPGDPTEVASAIVANVDLATRLLRLFWPRVTIVLTTLPPAAPRDEDYPAGEAWRCSVPAMNDKLGNLTLAAVRATNAALRDFARARHHCPVRSLRGGTTGVYCRNRVAFLDLGEMTADPDAGALVPRRGLANMPDCVHWGPDMYTRAWAPALRRLLLAYKRYETGVHGIRAAAAGVDHR